MAEGKFDLEDFAIPLEQVVSEGSHIWVTSGYTTVNPENHTVMGVNEFYSPPYIASNFNLGINISVDSILKTDRDIYANGSVGGLLYTGGTWYPHKIVRRGNYHRFEKGKLVSFSVVSELIPLFGQSGFIEKITIYNRSSFPLHLEMKTIVQPGKPSKIPLENWGFSPPYANSSNVTKSAGNIWKTESATIALYQQNAAFTINPGEFSVTHIGIVIDSSENDLPQTIDFEELGNRSEKEWERRLDDYTKNIPTLKSNNEALNEYYLRSIISGLVCIWENPSYTINPFLSTGGIDGGATCAYLWDIGGYSPQLATLMLDSAIVNIAKKMVSIDLEKYYAYTLNGAGVGVMYSYSPWAFTSLVSTIFKFLGPQEGLFNSAKKLILNNEKRQVDNHLIDYGNQHNLLEMRSTGWEHYVVSPNAERSWCLEQLAEMGKLYNYPSEGLNEQAEIITRAIQENLWDNKKMWFTSIYPNGHREMVYSIQVYDALRAGVCTPDMEKALVDHLKNDEFLGDFGITSISKKDSLHYEVLDTDWSGGGAYTGDGPQLALIMYEKNRPEIAWDILRRHFWMGEHLIYYPQEHYTDKPMVPEHKRANIISGLAGAEAILFGLIGFQPQYGGSLMIKPQPTGNIKIKIEGFKYRDNSFDVEQLSATKMVIYKNDSLYYDGVPKQVRLL